MAIVNANYEFIYCDIGTNGRVSDGGGIKNMTFYNKLLNGNISLPLPRKPESATSELPYVFVGDEAFALRKDFLKLSVKEHLLMNEEFLITVCHERGGL